PPPARLDAPVLGGRPARRRHARAAGPGRGAAGAAALEHGHGEAGVSAAPVKRRAEPDEASSDDDGPRHGLGGHAQSWRSFGSSVSRSQSPSRLKASTTSRIASPGKNDTHQALVTKSRPSAIIEPHAGVGGGMPAARKERDASTLLT